MEMKPPADLEYTVEETAALLRGDSPPALLDIREPNEWEYARLEEGRLITQELIQEIVESWDKGTPIICYCHHGIRSLQATHFLRTQGFTNVRSMRGGINAWSIQIDPSVPMY